MRWKKAWLASARTSISEWLRSTLMSSRQLPGPCSASKVIWSTPSKSPISARHSSMTWSTVMVLSSECLSTISTSMLRWPRTLVLMPLGLLVQVVFFEHPVGGFGNRHGHLPARRVVVPTGSVTPASISSASTSGIMIMPMWALLA